MDNILDKIYNQNPWWNNEQLIEEDSHIKELGKNKFVFLNQEFLKWQFQDGVYIVTGPRQIGKTTHLKLLIKDLINDKNKENFLYFNCDLLDSKQEIVDVAEQYLKNISVSGRRFIIFDEITSVKDSILAIKYLVDKGVSQKITYILTGSSTVNIKKTGEFLPGRRGQGRDFVFYPISFNKFLETKYSIKNILYSGDESIEKFYSRLKQQIPLTGEFNNYLTQGGIPKIINDYQADEEIESDNFNLYRNWLASEIAKNNKREQIAKMVLQRITASLGSDISYNAFAADTGIGSHNTVYDYLNFLEDAFVIAQIYHYDYNQKRINIRKNKKIYFTDPFLFWLLDWWLNGNLVSYKELAKNPILKSRLVENITFLHLKSLFNEVYFYKKEQEIDFIHKNTAWECKYQNQVSPSDFKELLKFPGNKFVITKSDFKITKEYQLLPIELFLLLDKKYFGFK